MSSSHQLRTPPVDDTPGDPRPDYHAVLRHEEEVGNDAASIRPRLPAGLRHPVLTASGLAGAAGLLLYLLAPTVSPLAVGLVAVTVLLASRAGYVLGGRASRDVQSSLEMELQHERNAIIGVITSLISALEARDPHTRNHSARVAKLAVRVGSAMGLDRAALYEIHLGGLLHDIGKIGIPDAILLKPAGLTPEEYRIMKTHSELGFRIISGLPGLEAVANIVHTHHEMFDGRGYPRGLSGEEIPIGARIIAVCDTYMSMAEDRPYRGGRELERVLKEIRRVSGRQLDPAVTRTLELLLAREIEQFGAPLDGFDGAEAIREEVRAA